MTELLDFAKTVGVPAAIAFFVLWRLDHRLDQLIREVHAMHEKLGAVLGRPVAERGRP